MSFSRLSQWLAVGITLAMAAGTLAFYPKTDGASDTLPTSSFYHQFHAAELVDQNGEHFNVHALLGKVTMFNFIFTHCSRTCPLQTAQLKGLITGLPPSLAAKTAFVSVSVDPATDTVEVLNDFVSDHQIDQSHWSFITGNPQNIQSIVENLKLFDLPTEKNPDQHSTDLWLVDPDGQLMMRYRGMPVDVERLSLEIRQLHSMHASAD